MNIKSTAYHIGKGAYFMGMSVEENPYTGEKYNEWLEGWYDGYDEYLAFAQTRDYYDYLEVEE